MAPITSGQKTISAPGTAERLHSGLAANCAVLVKALPGNTGQVYLGNVNGDVSSANGMPLAAGEVLVLDFIGDLSELWLDAATAGEGAAWLLLSQ